MKPNSKTWEINGPIRRKESGKIDFEKCLQILEALSALNAFYPKHNFLLDHREAQASLSGIDTIMNVTLEFVRFMPAFNNKIAVVIPNDPHSVSIAENFQACMLLYDYRFKFFTDIELAEAWLTDEEQPKT